MLSRRPGIPAAKPPAGLGKAAGEIGPIDEGFGTLGPRHADRDVAGEIRAEVLPAGTDPPEEPDAACSMDRLTPVEAAGVRVSMGLGEGLPVQQPRQARGSVKLPSQWEDRWPTR
jgi:hypothetical protein